MASRTISLDHIVILIPYPKLQNLPSWITNEFTITPGGRHSDGKTENKLICFKDGSYFELIAFINDDPAHRSGHKWDLPFGIIDFALITSDGASLNHSAMQTRLGSEVRYLEPKAGARKRDDGVELKWEVTDPDVTNGVKRGEVPFFCHDKTERNLRAPMDEKFTTHPHFAYGIKSLVIQVPSGKISALSQAYEGIMGVPNVAEEENMGVFRLERLFPVEGADRWVEFVIQEPQGEFQMQEVEKHGVLLGDMVVGGISMLGTGLIFRIDLDEYEEANQQGVGRVFRALDLPPGWSVPGVERAEVTPSMSDLEPVPETR